ncbi:hypothetical protein Q7P37_006759 [Cladosporium fusiforme]
MSALYQYHNAPEVAPAHGLEYDDTNYSTSSDKYPVVHSRQFDSRHMSKTAFNNDRPPRIIFGMKVRTFLLVAAVIVCILVGAAVGGAVGGKSMRENHADQTSSMENSNADEGVNGASSSSTATSATPSTYSAPLPTYTPLSSCPDANNTLYTSTFAKADTNAANTSTGLTFTTYCDVESPLTSVLTASTLSEAFVYSFKDCMDLCASVNYWFHSSNCSVAVYDPKASRPGNCWVGEADGVKFSELRAKNGMEVALLKES